MVILPNVRQIPDDPIPTITRGRQIAESNDVTILRKAMANGLKASRDYDECSNVLMANRTVEFTADIIVDTMVEALFNVVLWDAGWRYWEITRHKELGRSTYKLWLYPDDAQIKTLVTYLGLQLPKTSYN